MNYKRSMVALVFLFVLCGFSFTTVAQAQTYVSRFPLYEPYCEQKERIQSGKVQLDCTDTDALANGKGIRRVEYRLAATGKETTFYIPFLASARSLPPVTVTVNGQAVQGTVRIARRRTTRYAATNGQGKQHNAVCFKRRSGGRGLARLIKHSGVRNTLPPQEKRVTAFA